MVDKKGLKKAVKEAGLEIVKATPAIAPLIEGVRAYQSYIEEEQRQRFLSVLQERVNRVERLFDREWYSTEEGIAISKKLIAIALRAESADKVDYFADALINASKPMFTHDKRCKFCEILKTVSLPALRVLAYETNLQKERGPGHSPQVLIDQLIQRSGMDPFLVEACVRELYMLGVFSSTTDFFESGHRKSGFDEGIAAYSSFTHEFVEFAISSER